jgi:pyruvate formate lyase activating enzyme
VNVDGRGEIPFYGFITALAEDPIEKKPLYHYRPGSNILSLGFAGCNLRCPFCQNYRLSQGTGSPGTPLPPEKIIALARDRGFKQIAYTYSEPLIHVEFLLDCMAAAREAGIANVLVSNGFVSAEAAAEILPLTGAVNIDLKCFSEATYSKVLGGGLSAVLAFIEAAFRGGVHVEVTTLVVPGLNDSDAELDAAGRFIAGLSPDIPWHLSAYHPAYRWNAPPTDPVVLEAAARRAQGVLSFVYTGNIAGGLSDTLCPRCGNPLVIRRGYRVDTRGLILNGAEPADGYCCSRCGSPVPFRA